MKIKSNIYPLALVLTAIVQIFIYTATAFAGDEQEPGFFSDLFAPATPEARGPFTVGMSLTLMLLAFEDQIIEPAQTETVEDKPLGSASKYGDLAGQGVPNVLYFLGASLSGYFSQDNTSYRRAKHMALATIYSGVMAQALKNIVREPRPNDKNDRVSFPSGHTTTAFAFASVVGVDHGWGWGIPAYMLALAVGYSRMNDNKHYIHDVVAGATLGIGYGLGICGNMSARGESPRSYVNNFFIKPNEEGGQSLVFAMNY